MIEVLEEDYSEAAMIRLMAKFEDLVYQNNYELFDSEWMKDDIYY